LWSKRVAAVRGKGYTFIFDCWTVYTENELLSCRSEVGETGDGKIFMVQVGIFS